MANHLAITSAAQINSALDEARRYCAEHGRVLTWERLAYCCGVDRNTLTDYRTGKVQMAGLDEEEREGIRSALTRAWAECNAELAETMMDKGNCIGAIFLGKNNYGYVDKQDITGEIGVTFVGEDGIAD